MSRPKPLPPFCLVYVLTVSSVLLLSQPAKSAIDYSCASVLSNPGIDHLYMTVAEQNVAVAGAGADTRPIKFKRVTNAGPVQKNRAHFTADKKSWSLTIETSLISGGKTLPNGRAGGFASLTTQDGFTTDYVCVK